ncbi:hypothetical protein AGLY_008730 [Aphis glycines]|uniref:Ubiquitin-like protease family profile domain-containing protein n=1 Tax=Aphis glycines TaxID=307491 RepID=A0A6G0TKP1_APHGL|nr:hypothetical protein AGLY_008730 [Aphis glycines]
MKKAKKRFNMETEKCFKRTAPYKISNRTIKQLQDTKKKFKKWIMHDHSYHAYHLNIGTSTCVIPESTKLLSTKILEDRLGGRLSIININDYKINWYAKKLSEEDRERMYVFSTYFYTTLAKSFNASDYPAHYTASQIRHEKVKRWTKNVDIFKKDFVFIPVNENRHWFLA